MFESKVTIYVERVVNLTLLITIMEDDPDSYSELQIQEVKIQIKQLEALIVELQASIQTSSTLLITFRQQVTNKCYIITGLNMNMAFEMEESSPENAKYYCVITIKPVYRNQTLVLQPKKV